MYGGVGCESVVGNYLIMESIFFFIDWGIETLDYVIINFTTGLGTIGLFLCAYYAFYQWKKEILIRDQIDFLKNLNFEIHKFSKELLEVIEYFRYIKIGVESYIEVEKTNPLSIRDKKRDFQLEGFKKFIASHGQRNGEKLGEKLKLTEESLFKLQSMIITGSIYKFKEYKKIEVLVRQIILVRGKLNAFGLIITSGNNLNWSHSLIIKNARSAISMNVDQFNQVINKSLNDFVNFYKNEYEDILEK